MPHYPKHLPSTPTQEQAWAREDIYRRGEQWRIKYLGWEGIDAANARQSKPTKTPEQVIAVTLNRLYERLSVARWTTVHIDQDTRSQVKVDPKITANLLKKLLDTANSTRNPEIIANVAEKVRLLRKEFKTPKQSH